MDYWLNWTKPTDPIINSLLVWPMYSIDKSNSIRTKKNDNISKSMKGNQNAVKSFEKVSKQLKTVWNSLEQIKTVKTDRSIEDIEVIEDNKENIKRKYLDNVLLTDTEYNKLIEKYWKWVIDRKIEDLNNYIGSKWKKYKSHYFTILERLRREWVKPLEKKQEKTENNDLNIDTRPEWMKEAFPLNK